MYNKKKEAVIFRDLGKIDYQQAWDYQENLLQENVRIKAAVRDSQLAVDDSQLANSLTTHHSPLTTQHHLLFCEHPPVYTLGKSGKKANLLVSENNLKQQGIAYIHSNRGGDITFHGAGQLVAYPVLDLEKFFTDIGKYLRSLEQVIIDTLAAYNIKGDRSTGETGVWIEPDNILRARKICAMGVRCSRWITMHGLALNVNTDLSYFNNIIPCGIQNKQVTSMQKELGYIISMEEVKEQVKNNFEKVFDAKLLTFA